MVDSTCVVCGVVFQKTQPAKYCSQPCRSFAIFLSIVERGVRDSPEDKAKRATWAKANRWRYRDRQREAEALRYRTDGGRTRERSRERSRRISAETADERRGKDKRRKAQGRLDRAARGSTGGNVVWAYGPCRRCGEMFTGKQNYSLQVPCHCSKRCSSADMRDRRRAQKAGVKLTVGRRYRVFERDGWVCQICGDLVDRSAVVPALDAPTIDHRIPLAAGGAHDESNWQTAHFYCNSVKRDQVGFDFAA